MMDFGRKEQDKNKFENNDMENSTMQLVCRSLRRDSASTRSQSCSS